MVTTYIFTEVSDIRWRDDTGEKLGSPSISRMEQSYFLIPSRLLVEYTSNGRILSLSSSRGDLSGKLQAVLDRQSRKSYTPRSAEAKVENLHEIVMPRMEAKKIAKKIQDWNSQRQKLPPLQDYERLKKKQWRALYTTLADVRQQERSLVERIKYLAREKGRREYYDQEGSEWRSSP